MANTIRVRRSTTTSAVPTTGQLSEGELAVNVYDGKLFFKGTVKNQSEVNRIWDAIKTVPDWRNDLVGEISIDPQAPKDVTYTVKPGDTLSKIAREQLGDANAYMAIFDANTDQLSDPDKIRPGQVLTIPSAA